MESFYILFLDIDGVLHRPWDLPATTTLEEHVNKFSTEAVQNLSYVLEQIYKRTGKYTFVVLSSSWRKHGDVERLRQLFKQWPFAGFIVDKTPMGGFNQRPAEIVERLGVWCKQHKVINYIVIDDYPIGMEVFGPCYIRTCERKLLTKENADEAVKNMLNKSEVTKEHVDDLSTKLAIPLYSELIL